MTSTVSTRILAAAGLCVASLFAVRSASAATQPALFAVVNAASFKSGPLAPGEIIALFGDGLGPATPVAAAPDTAGHFGIELATTRVVVNDVPAPVLYTSSKQVIAVVPFSLQPGAPVTVYVDYQTIGSTPLISRIAESSPAIFTATQTGADQVAAANQDGSPNSPERPAVPGSIISLFVSGGGQLQPAATDGAIVTGARNAAARVSAAIAGLPADIVYAGAAPGLVAGMFQVNVRLPDATPSGNHVFIALNVAGHDSPAGATIAVAGGSAALPSAPAAFTAAAGGAGVALAWTAPPAGVRRVRTERSSPGAGSFSEIAALDSVASFVDTEVGPSAGYSWRVRFETASGLSDYSGEARATVPASYLAPPQGLTAAALSASAVFVSWTNPSSNASAISVERSSGAGFSEVARLSGGAGSYRDAGVSASTAYSYRVRTVGAAGTSAPSRSAAATTPAAPALPDIAPRLHPVDPHRLTLGGKTFTMSGYYPSLGAFTTDQPDPTLYRTLIDTLAANGVNYFRTAFTMGQPFGASMNPYQRTGPGNAQDGGLRFDLGLYNQAYFDYWRAIIQYAQAKGLIVQICMMDGWHASADIVERSSSSANAWGLRYDYYFRANNVNGVNVSTTADLFSPSGAAFYYQRALTRKIVDSLGDLPNIVWEIANESGALPWELLLADDVTAYERAQGLYEHLIIPRDLPGHQYVPGQCDNTGAVHSPLARAFAENLVLITDNDCISDGTAADHRAKAWAALTAGAQMDYFHFEIVDPETLTDADTLAGMRYVGFLRKFTSDLDIDLAGMTSLDGEVSSGWALGHSGGEYVIYLPNGGSTSVPAFASATRAIWFNPRDGNSFEAGKGPQFQAPDSNDWVLYLLR